MTVTRKSKRLRLTNRDLSPGKNLLFAMTACATLLYLGWRAFFTLPFGYGVVSMVAALLLLVSEIVAGLEALEQYLNMVNFREPELPDIPKSWYPDVDVLVMTHNEDTDVIFKTVNGCKHMDYPDKSRVHIYICDDNNRPEMRELAGKLGVGYFGLSENLHAKAGNMNNALAKTSSPYVATFDADMIPRHSFLMRTIPYFFLPRLKKNAAGVWVERETKELDPNHRIGFIQAPQSFYNADLFQYNLYAERRVPNEQDYFFRDINVGRNRNNAAIYAGSNAVLSRDALNEVGGIAVNTITEDFETGLRIQAKGYRTYALSERLAIGLAPHSITGLIAQRERWARGCVQSLRNFGLFRSPLPLGAKISYLFSLVYWWTSVRRFVYIATPILSSLLDIHVVETTLAPLLLFWLPYYILNERTLDHLSGHTRTQHWSNLIETIMFPYLIVPVIMETLGIKKRKFVVTQKRKAARPAKATVLALPHLFLLAASAVGLIFCLAQNIRTGTLYNVIIIFWLIVNGKNLLLAIFFMMGRDNFRLAERFFVSIPVVLRHGGREYAGHTTDISEGGMSVRIEYPFYLPDDDEFEASVRTGKYHADMRCRLSHVEYDKNVESWRYSMRVCELSEANRQEYFQIVFDRDHTLPDKILNNQTLYDDISLNISERVIGEKRRAIRRLPRIHFNRTAIAETGREVKIVDFNYKFAWLVCDYPPPDYFADVAVAPGVSFTLQAVDTAAARDGGRLYMVENWRELLECERFHNFLDSIVKNNRLETRSHDRDHSGHPAVSQERKALDASQSLPGSILRADAGGA